MRIRGDMNPPTPWPPDMATGENPPDGAMIDYYLGPGVSGVVTLEVLDGKGVVVSRYRSDAPVPPLDPRYPVPTLWARPPRVLSAAAGHHRFLWDMHYPRGARDVDWGQTRIRRCRTIRLRSRARRGCCPALTPCG